MLLNSSNDSQNNSAAHKRLVPEFGDKWFSESSVEGQLLLDVYQTEAEIIVKAAMAGVKLEDLNIFLNNDMLTIRGQREIAEDMREADYLYKECYWGPFSRSLVLPAEVDSRQIEAFLENGVLTIKLLKQTKLKRIQIKLKE